MFKVVTRTYFNSVLSVIRKNVMDVRINTVERVEGKATCYLALDESAGVCITSDGELVALFSIGSTVRGRDCVEHAITHGATHLNCFDGKLVGYYQSLGFVETGREPNWTEGEPDVVYMTLGSEL